MMQTSPKRLDADFTDEKFVETFRQSVGDLCVMFEPERYPVKNVLTVAG
ncbi:MAG: hypothetical protein LBS54_03420 [Dysgonamonadaceae bacterium]|nr:hypothetical protein [Dysgonamonadaceae bacterium]